MSQTGPVSYEVREHDSDTVHRRHGDQTRGRAMVYLDTVVTNSQGGPLEGKEGSSSQDIADSTGQSLGLLET